MLSVRSTYQYPTTCVPLLRSPAGNVNVSTRHQPPSPAHPPSVHALPHQAEAQRNTALLAHPAPVTSAQHQASGNSLEKFEIESLLGDCFTEGPQNTCIWYNKVCFR
jgi:hypothetical protein